MFATDETVGLAEWIICLFLVTYVRSFYIWVHLSLGQY